MTRKVRAFPSLSIPGTYAVQVNGETVSWCGTWKEAVALSRSLVRGQKGATLELDSGH